MPTYYAWTYSRSEALRARQHCIEVMHQIYLLPEQNWWWKEMDQLSIDTQVAILWDIQKRWGMTPHICRDRYCLCHVAIAEGAPDEYRAPSDSL